MVFKRIVIFSLLCIILFCLTSCNNNTNANRIQLDRDGLFKGIPWGETINNCQDKLPYFKHSEETEDRPGYLFFTYENGMYGKTDFESAVTLVFSNGIYKRVVIYFYPIENERDILDIYSELYGFFIATLTEEYGYGKVTSRTDIKGNELTDEQLNDFDDECFEEIVWKTSKSAIALHTDFDDHCVNGITLVIKSINDK